LDGALRVYEETLAFQRAGAVMVEMECVAAEIAAEITKRVDILGFLEPRFPGLGKPYEGPLPRHARRYANLFEETKRGFAAFRADVERGNFPAPAEMIKADPSVVAAFRSQVGGATSG
jgi:3-methyl-2-oxobutanoate hydroxymethyltransferase